MRKSFIVLLLLTAAIAIGYETDQLSSAFSAPPKVEKAPMQIPVADIGSKTLILGDLGVPIGERVTISGVKKTNGPIDDMFWLDTINGKKLPRVRGIQVNGIAKWPDGTRATLRGYEEGVIRFTSMKDGNLDPKIKNFKPSQTIFLSFRVRTIVEPKNLKMDPNDLHPD